MSTDHGFERAGVQPTVVLVHGGVAAAGGWNGVIEVLQQQGYTIVALAHPPAGAAHAPGVPGSARARPARPSSRSTPGAPRRAGHSWAAARAGRAPVPAEVTSGAEAAARLAQRPAGSRGARWRDYAACRDVDPELFFPAGSAGPALLQISQAKLVCAACPVRVPCLDWALASHQEAGIWGGTSEDERRALRRRHG